MMATQPNQKEDQQQGQEDRLKGEVVRPAQPEVDPPVHERQERYEVPERETHPYQHDLLPAVTQSSIGTSEAHRGLALVSYLCGPLYEV
jgi:hypothetical protein